MLTLDGGGAKGFYSLGVLKEVEALVGQPLHTCFDLVFGTSTGAIIAALIALGTPVEDIRSLYKQHVPKIMSQRRPRDRSAALAKAATAVAGNTTFDQTKTSLGIVSTNWNEETPLIFKSSSKQAQGRSATFVPGFGCTIAEAVEASCSAYPFFERKKLKTSDGVTVELVDGGYCANNPTLYAIADASRAFGKTSAEIRVLSVGVGGYPEPEKGFVERWKYKFWLVQLLQKTMDTNTKSMDRLRTILFGDVQTVRINESYTEPEMATDLFEHDLTKLDRLYAKGRESFGLQERSLERLLLE